MFIPVLLWTLINYFFLSFSEATMEIDVAKGRRDWAFSERDKVVLERESIRTLCDKLRRERDRWVTRAVESFMQVSWFALQAWSMIPIWLAPLMFDCWWLPGPLVSWRYESFTGWCLLKGEWLGQWIKSFFSMPDKKSFQSKQCLLDKGFLIENEK